MNDDMLRKLAEETAKQTIASSWPFWLILLSLALLSLALVPYLRARSAKHGEVAASKADAHAILEQLREATAATKAVELTLSHGDWIQRERNALKRTKLERLIVTAFAIATWANEDTRDALKGEDFKDRPPLDEFTMLSMLYFPELKAETENVVNHYRKVMIESAPIRLAIMRLSGEIESAAQAKRPDLIGDLLERRKQVQTESQNPVIANSVALYNAVEALSVAAHNMMERLTGQEARTS